jgi:hypothetical protein
LKCDNLEEEIDVQLKKLINLIKTFDEGYNAMVSHVSSNVLISKYGFENFGKMPLKCSHGDM